jgi:hypothetical protein
MAPTVGEVGQDTRIRSDARKGVFAETESLAGASDAIAIWSTSDDCRFRRDAGCAVSPDKTPICKNSQPVLSKRGH